MNVLNALDNSCLYTILSKILMIMLVREIDLNWLHSDIGDSFGTGLILASFHSCGTYCSSRERLNNLVITGARYCP